ncbi:MAG: carboxypeptidase regulatory-like domain-containing protein [Candidatus Wallbacteria bacterium]|nr:carboxypeptidase regulatory-like domain-containing protein [Candidatus Wallbacteria bacterium]
MRDNDAEASDGLASRVQAVVSLAGPHQGSLLPVLGRWIGEVSSAATIADALVTTGFTKLEPARRFFNLVVERYLPTESLEDLTWFGPAPARDPVGLVAKHPNPRPAERARETAALLGKVVAISGGTSELGLRDASEELAKVSAGAFFGEWDSDGAVTRNSSLAAVSTVATAGTYFGMAPDGRSIDRIARFNGLGHTAVHDNLGISAGIHNFLSAMVSSEDPARVNHPPVANASRAIDWDAPAQFPAELTLSARPCLDPDGDTALAYTWTIDAGDLERGGFVGVEGVVARASGSVVPFRALAEGNWHVRLAVTDGRGGIGLDESTIRVRPASGTKGVRLSEPAPAGPNRVTLRWRATGLRGYELHADTLPHLTRGLIPRSKVEQVLQIPEQPSGNEVARELTLAPGTTWYFRVFDELVSDNRLSGGSNEVRIALPAEGTQPPPSDVQLTLGSVSQSNVSVSWKATSSYRLGSYRLVRGSSPTVGLEDGLLCHVTVRKDSTSAWLGRLPPGRHYLRLFVVDVDGNATGSEPLLVEVPSGVGTLAGTVRTQSGNPVAQAILTASRETTPVATVVSGSEGDFAFSDVPVEIPLIVAVQPPTSALRPRSVQVTLGSSEPGTLSVVLEAAIPTIVSSLPGDLATNVSVLVRPTWCSTCHWSRRR